MPSIQPFSDNVGTAMSCMVVDDDRVCRLVLQHQLALLGASAFSAVDCADALRQSALRRPGVVLLDTCLPDGDGYGLAMRLRRQHGETSVAPLSLISISALSGDTHARCCAAAGIDAVLPKPTPLFELAHAIGLPAFAVSVSHPPAASPGTPAMGAAVDRLLELYRVTCLQDLKCLALAVRCGDADRARVFAHRLKGASAWIGVAGISAIASVFEPPEGSFPAPACVQEAALRQLERVFSSERLAYEMDGL